MKFNNVYALALAPSAAYGHAIMQAFNGLPQGQAIYMPSYDGPITDVNSQSMACNGSPNYGFKSSSSVVDVQAGSTVKGAWLHTLTSTGADSTANNKVIDSSHKGPLMVYMKKVSDATQNPSAGPGDGWFKIAHSGLLSPSQWAVDKLISDGGIQTATIPTCIANGQYLLRFELLALHSAYSQAGAQFYMECVQINVIGGTGTKTPATVQIPGTYKANDPGVLVQIWNNNGQPYPTSGQYKIPGPDVFTC